MAEVAQAPQTIERTACAKIILCGEHAVVYGQPAIALPFPSLRARATIAPRPKGVWVHAPDIRQRFQVRPGSKRPLARIVLSTLAWAGIPLDQVRFTLTLTSDIPVASHLGSGAAVSTACARAVAAYTGRELPPAAASELVYEVERLHHGTPSGIDNTVIAYEQPVWFVRGSPPEPLAWADLAGLPLLIADTGISTPTKIPVGDVRRAWEAEPARFEGYFQAIGGLVAETRQALQRADAGRLGGLMNENHALLRTLGVSSPELDRLIQAARAAGALGAKMSGGGRGGNMIALAQSLADLPFIEQALRAAGAAQVWALG